MASRACSDLKSDWGNEERQGERLGGRISSSGPSSGAVLLLRPLSTAMPSVKPAPTGEVTPRRLHISGIHSSVKPLELINRFSSFGTILGGEDGVAGLGLDANGTQTFRRQPSSGLPFAVAGTPRKFAFITLETTDQQLAKCAVTAVSLSVCPAYPRAGTSMLNGSLWKGHKLRIALAKPDYHARCVLSPPLSLAGADLVSLQRRSGASCARRSSQARQAQAFQHGGHPSAPL